MILTSVLAAIDCVGHINVMKKYQRDILIATVETIPNLPCIANTPIQFVIDYQNHPIHFGFYTQVIMESPKSNVTVDCTKYIPLLQSFSCKDAMQKIINEQQFVKISMNGVTEEYTITLEENQMFIALVCIGSISLVIGIISIFCFSRDKCYGYKLCLRLNYKFGFVPEKQVPIFKQLLQRADEEHEQAKLNSPKPKAEVNQVEEQPMFFDLLDEDFDLGEQIEVGENQKGYHIINSQEARD
ncbi:Hypothetical_protein [Hexamita inflata]|uniref:Hypothetical_protein n=1 Tax=Hexamita inflata TaxID=28002 RepID=A0AA86UWJ3_9EUKA|nr:Hypothetical protein HINF_LOCUS62385 [Hexamita inflata]